MTSSLRGKVYALIFFGIYILAGLTVLSTVKYHQQLARKSEKLIVTNWPGVENGGQGSRAVELYPSIAESSKRLRVPSFKWCQPLKFLNGVQRPIIALVSFPGSGNTWLRYLIQQATGIYTGSVYKDFGLLKNGFPGEYIMDSSVIVVKTHEIGAAAYREFDKAILLVRDPMEAIQAEFNRQGGGHIGFASPERYKIAKGKYWEKFVQDQIVTWKLTNLDWLFNFTNPLIVVFYDQLISNLETNLREIMKFLEFNVTESQLKCTLERREGIYRRKKRMIYMDPFTKEMKTKLKATKQEVYSQLYNYLRSGKRGDFKQVS